jgi:Proteolysis_6 C-terminal
MDSKPLTCLQKGSVVTVLKPKISSDYDILSRRVYVHHTTKDPVSKGTVVSEGWASVQSSQGYVILSPLSSLCYNNTRWGSTRPIIKQCGHAAHLKCVETHMLSLHQRAAGDQPYDGRFAANINDGEFLCPLCKQLSNILIPRDSRSTVGQRAVATVNESIQGGKKIDGSLRKLFVGARFLSEPVSPLTRKALEDFGSHLHAAMSVPWERMTGAQKVKQERWYAAIQKWDFEEGDVDPMQNDAISVKNLMRLLRQQLISWASIGHTAAALEAGSRGVEVALPFGIVSETSDPWPEYSSRSMNTHPMMLELKRSLTGSSGLLEVLFIELSESIGGRNMKPNETTVVGSCLADILEGKSWIANLSSVDLTKTSGVGIWSGVSALLSAIPSHVARDGTVALRSEAKATAAAMWVVRGVSYTPNVNTEPPAPLAIRQLFASQQQAVQCIPPNWGTMDPFVNKDASCSPETPFRPAVACGFMYTPLLAWDLCTLAGALLSCILANKDHDLPTSDDLLRLAHTLLVGRIVQAVITPCGFDIPDEMSLDDEDCWTIDEVDAEGLALAKLVAYCRDIVHSKSVVIVNGFEGNATALSGIEVLAGIGRAVLPFARALVLMLRACTASIRERRERSQSILKPTESDKILDSALCQAELMTLEDGFHFFKAFHCPNPSQLLDGDWLSLINRWLVSMTGLESYHGFMGRSFASNVSPTVSKAVSTTAGITLQRSNTPMFCDESSDENMMSDAEEAGDGDEVDRVVSRRLGGLAGLLQDDMDDSDEELADSMDEAEEMISFEIPGMGISSRLNAAATNQADDGNSSDNSTESPDGDHDPLDKRFANVSNSPIIPYEPSLLGTMGVGPGRHGSTFDFTSANELMIDMSHFGTVHRKGSPTFTLIRLPKSFVELYNIVNKIKGRDDNGTVDESDDIGTSETSICLLTGAVMRSGSARRVFSRAARPPGACTLHARKTASGIGIFFLVQKCTVLLMHNNKSAYSPSIYVDEHGEEDPQLKRGRPLFLNEARYRALELLWRQQSIPREVAQIRSTSDRVIRDNWY